MMGEELSNHVWQLPPTRIAEMLHSFGQPPPIEEAVKSLTSKLKSNVSVSLTSGSERANYDYLTFILNECIDSCVEVIEKHITARRWFGGLRFIVWDKPVSDRVDGAPPLKPDLAGLKNPPAGSSNI
jgi:hypothetical protein